jgi:predicted DNA-binding transcriptional regulator AlpA
LGEWQYARLAGPGREPPMIPEVAQRPVMSAEEVFAELGIDRSTGYKAIRDGTFPLPILRIGRIIRVPTVAVRRLLQLDGDVEDGGVPDKEVD